MKEQLFLIGKRAVNKTAKTIPRKSINHHWTNKSWSNPIVIGSPTQGIGNKEVEIVWFTRNGDVIDYGCD